MSFRPFGAYVSDLRAIHGALLYMFRNHDLATFARLVGDHLRAWRGARSKRRLYPVLDYPALEATTRGPRVFVFGSGYSLNEMGDDEYARIARHDTLGFSGSIYLRRLKLKYLLFRAWTETSDGSLAWKNDAREVTDAITANPCLAETIFCLQEGFTAIFPNLLIAHEMWPKDRRVAFFRSDKTSKYPHLDFRRGIVHGLSTLGSAISLAVALGYKEIVLVGVDLYDSRYFWLPPDKTLGWSASEKKLVASDTSVRGASVGSVHNTVNNGVVDFMGDWARHVDRSHGIRISVYNRRSLLAATMPVFEWEDPA